MTETPALNLEYEYKARNPNQLVLLLEDNQLLHKLAKNFAVRITCLSQHMITVYEQVVALLKPTEVSLLYSMDGISITEETFPSLQHVPFIRLEEQQFVFFDYLLAIPRVESADKLKGDYHTHADYKDEYRDVFRPGPDATLLNFSDRFSRNDLIGSIEDMVREGDQYLSFLGTPSGKFYQYSPKEDKVTEIKY